MVPTTAAHAADRPCGTGGAGDGGATGKGKPYDELGIAGAAQRAGGSHAGKGIHLYVVDTLSSSDAHAAIAQGIAEEIAPGLTTHLVKVAGDLPTASTLASALDGLRGIGSHDIVLVPRIVATDPTLKTAVAGLTGRALVIAPIGDAPTAADDPVVGQFYEADSNAPLRDAAGAVAPAAYAGVLGVGVAGSSFGAEAPALLDSDVDLVAPVGGGVSKDGIGPCVVDGITTDWAAAEVAGVAAMVWAKLPALSAGQVVTRLEKTADGGGSWQGNLAGYGVVQPLAAVTVSDQALAARGPVDPDQRRAPAPQTRDDVLAPTRRAALWWGLLGGGGLVVALLLRPLLARRRS
ncbi:hypothetical protein GCM10027076_16230 [Nocardioides montaniterrae]